MKLVHPTGLYRFRVCQACGTGDYEPTRADATVDPYRHRAYLLVRSSSTLTTPLLAPEPAALAAGVTIVIAPLRRDYHHGRASSMVVVSTGNPCR